MLSLPRVQGPAGACHISRASWHLTTLSIASNFLMGAGVDHLVSARWPLLARLDVTHNCLHVAAWAALKQRWPGLQLEGAPHAGSSVVQLKIGHGGLSVLSMMAG
jgi:hypothetical protein